MITLFGLVFLSKRSLPSLVALGGAVVLTLLLLAIERWVVTDREAVESTLVEMIAAIEANDTPAVVALVDPAATALKAEIEMLMPMVKVSDSKATSIRVDVDESAQPMEATCHFRGKLQGVHQRSGMQVFYFDKVDMEWGKQNDRWLLQNFTAYQKGKPLDAVESLRSNRATSAAQ